MANHHMTDTGYVYCIYSPSTRLYKIGITKKDRLKTRMKELKVGTSTKLIDKVWCNDYKNWEKKIHKFNAAFRLPQSEWFNITAEQANAAMSAIEAKVSKKKWKVTKDGKNVYLRRKGPNGWYTVSVPKKDFNKIAEPLSDRHQLDVAPYSSPAVSSIDKVPGDKAVQERLELLLRLEASQRREREADRRLKELLDQRKEKENSTGKSLLKVAAGFVIGAILL